MKKVAGVGDFKAMARSSRTVDHQDVCKARRDLKSIELLEAQNERSTAGPGSNGSLKSVFTLFTLKVICHI